MYTDRLPRNQIRRLAAAAVVCVVALVGPLTPSASAVTSVTVSGRVFDGSGHGWSLYAAITVDGQSGTTYTSPYTGKYTMTVPASATYTVHTTALYPGYVPQSQSVHVGSANVVLNVGVPIDQSTCSAPGYSTAPTGTTQTFDGSTTPAGWTVTNNTPAGGWAFNDPHPRGNLTGGTGGFAIVDSDFLGVGNTEDTFLATPVTDFSTATDPVLSFDTDYRDLTSVAQVDLSTDGGGTWSTVWDRSGADARMQHVALTLPSAVGHAAVQVRFHYTGTWAWWWEVDNVFLGDLGCSQVSGGLVAGVVSLGQAATTVVGATVTSLDNPSEHATSAATPDDPAVPDGFYWMFSSLLGQHRFQAVAPGPSQQTKNVTVKENATTKALFTLPASNVVTSPAAISRTVNVNGHAQATLTLRNTGTAAAHVTLAVAPAVTWLSLNHLTVTVPAGGQTAVTVRFDAATADVTGSGTYTTSITVTGATNTVTPVPVTLTVRPPV